jgi:hypothetical protein
MRQHHFNTSLSLQEQAEHSVVVEEEAQVDTDHPYQANQLAAEEF